MNKLKLIEHSEFGVIRTEIVGGEVWFCGKDVCRALGYGNSREAIKKHCRAKGVAKRYVEVTTGTKKGVAAADVGNTKRDTGVAEPAIQRVAVQFISEGNLYRLILRSRLPGAERFEAWVCDEVLPSLRKRGFYGVSLFGAGDFGDMREFGDFGGLGDDCPWLSYREGFLCVRGGWLYGDGGIMTRCQYKNMVRRGEAAVVCRGGNGRYAWVRYDSLPLRFRLNYENKFGVPRLSDFSRERLLGAIVRVGDFDDRTALYEMYNRVMGIKN